MVGVAKLDVRNLGDYIREQRSAAQISLRQLASLAGVSNPYLSQIERGLRKPSAEILQQIAKALRISAEALYVQAGILEERYGDSDVPAAILGDAYLAERQKHLAANDVELAVKSLLEQMSQALSVGERIEIRGFGSFSLHYRPPRMGRNPKTGDAVALPGKHVPHFKPGKELRERVNDGAQSSDGNG